MTIRERGNVAGNAANYGNDNVAEHHSDARQHQPLLFSIGEKGKGMLVLGRYKNQEIYVGDDIRVIIDDIRGSRVRIRIIAPPSIGVFREEIYKRAVAALSIGARQEVTEGLVLTRRTDESIRIGDDIRLVVVDVRHDSVRIGIEAPRSVAVHRKEVFEAIKAGHKPVQKTVGNINSVINVRPVTTPTIVARREVVPMT